MVEPHKKKLDFPAMYRRVGHLSWMLSCQMDPSSDLAEGMRIPLLKLVSYAHVYNMYP